MSEGMDQYTKGFRAASAASMKKVLLRAEQYSEFSRAYPWLYCAAKIKECLSAAGKEFCGPIIWKGLPYSLRDIFDHKMRYEFLADQPPLPKPSDPPPCPKSVQLTVDSDDLARPITVELSPKPKTSLQTATEAAVKRARRDPLLRMRRPKPRWGTDQHGKAWLYLGEPLGAGSAPGARLRVEWSDENPSTALGGTGVRHRSHVGCTPSSCGDMGDRRHTRGRKPRGWLARALFGRPGGAV